MKRVLPPDGISDQDLAAGKELFGMLSKLKKGLNKTTNSAVDPKDIFKPMEDDEKTVDLKIIQKLNESTHERYVEVPTDLVDTNRTSLGMKYIDEIGKQVFEAMMNTPQKVQGGGLNFSITISQRFLSYLMSQGTPETTTLVATMKKEKFDPPQSFDASYSATKFKQFHPPNIGIISLGTGVGKTVIALMTCGQILLNDTTWNNYLTNCQNMLIYQYKKKSTGFYDGPVDIEKPPSDYLARLIVFFVPKNVFHNWINTTIGLQEEFERLYKKKVTIWTGKSQNQSLKIAHESKKAIFWFLHMDPDSYGILQAHPEIVYIGKVLDESTISMRKNNPAPFSPRIGPVFVTQATIAKLVEAMRTNPKDTVRLALGSSRIHETWIHEKMLLSEVQERLQQFVLLNMMMPSKILRNLISNEARTYMPQGIKMHRLTYKKTTANGRINGADELEEMSFEEMLRNMLPSHQLTNPILNKLIGLKNDITNDSLKEAIADLENIPDAQLNSYNKSKISLAVTKLQQIVNPEEPFECPVCYEIIEDDKMHMVPCCTTIYCKKCLDDIMKANRNCGMCRNELKQVVNLQKQEDEEKEEESTIDATDLLSACQQISKLNQPARKALFKVINWHITNTMKDAPPRILLYYSMKDSNKQLMQSQMMEHIFEDFKVPKIWTKADANDLVGKIVHTNPQLSQAILNSNKKKSNLHCTFSEQQLNAMRVSHDPDICVKVKDDYYIPSVALIVNLEAIASNRRKNEIYQGMFNDETMDFPIIFMCNTGYSYNSQSIAGMNLQNTNLSIVNGYLDNSNMLQMFGRVMRMGSKMFPAPVNVVMMQSA